MAAIAVPSTVEAFVAEHSELFKEQKAGDAAATVEGCFPPASAMPTERVVECLTVLACLFDERVQAGSSSPEGHRLRCRIFWVRETTLHKCLSGVDNEPGFADLKTVADYMLLPKLLVEALELEGAVAKARRNYHEAIGGYNLATATISKPRLFDFLLKDDGLKGLMLAAVRKANLRVDLEGTLVYCVSGGDAGRGWRPSSFRTAAWRGVLDGLMGESASEYGYTPVTDRLVGYSCGCIIAGREIPVSALPEQSASDSMAMCLPLFGMAAAIPLCLAAYVGSVSALQRLRDAGWDLMRPQDNVFSHAAAANSPDALLWLVSLHPENFKALGHEAFKAALIAGNFETAKWVVETLGFPLDPAPDFTGYTGGACTCAAKRNDLEALKWLHLELGFELHHSVALHALKHGNTEMLDWYLSKLAPKAIESGDAWDWEAFTTGLRAGHLALAMSLLNYGRPRENEDEDDDQDFRSLVLEAACEGSKGDTGVLDLLMSVDPPLPSPVDAFPMFHRLAEAAGKFGHAQVLGWMLRHTMVDACPVERKQTLCRSALNAALSYGQEGCARSFLDFDGVRPALINCRPVVPKSLDTSVAPSVLSTEALKHFAPYFDFSQGYCAAIIAMDADAVRRLNSAGLSLKQDDPHHRTSLSELVSTPFIPSDKRVAFLRVLFEECGLKVEPGPYTVTCEWAAHTGSTELMALLVEKGGVLSPVVLSKAAFCGHLPLCRWLRQKGVDWPVDLANKARSRHADEVAAWVEEQQSKEATEATEAAAEPAVSESASMA